jgi:two-component system, NarL family, invasion response regulator UvrY
MNKESAPEELIRAVRKILAGGTYVSPGLAERPAVDLRENTGQPLHETLSNREFEVLRLIALGKTVTQIAEELHLSVATVNTHRAHVLEKMNMTTIAELIHYAVRNHLVD